VNHLNDFFHQNVFSSSQDFKLAVPIPMSHVDDFLPKEFAIDLYNECNLIDDKQWKLFTRNGSRMKEWNDLSYAPVAHQLVSYLHSSSALRHLSEVTGIEGLIPDPHLVGAGYNKSYRGDTLKVHTDFNWNDSLKLHRALSLIIYLTPDWDPTWGGALDFYNKDREHVVISNDCLFNRCLFWKYDKFGYHGYEQPLTCPDTICRTAFRVFYYTSNSRYLDDDPPHRSLYWIDETTKLPTDKREEL
jgi:hypothetical protein